MFHLDLYLVARYTVACCRFISSLLKSLLHPCATHRCDSTATCSFSRNSSDPDCGEDTGKIVEPNDVLAPAVTYAAPSQQLPSIIKAVPTDVIFDITGLMKPQFSTTVVAVSAPQVVDSLSPL